MSIDTRLRDAMRARVAGVEARELRSLPVRGRRVWPALAAGFAVVLVAVLAIAVFTSGDDGKSGPAATAQYPSRIVAITRDGRLVVLSSKDGHVLRTIARDTSTDGGIAVSPGGRFVYYTRVTGAGCTVPPRSALTEIARLPLHGGRPEVIASQVRLPATSPDGRFLAFTGTSCSDAGGVILVQDLTDGSTRRWEMPASASMAPYEIRSLSWAPDGEHLLFEWTLDGYPRVLDTASASALLSAQVVQIGDCCGVDGYLGSTGLLVGVVPQGGVSKRQDVITLDPATGARLQTLFELPEPCCGLAATSNSSGRHVLVSGNELFRWTRGDRHPVRIATEVTAAVWLARS